MAAASREIFTIGHSTHPIERFIELLQAHQITALADVRSSPYSEFNHQFNREPLKTALEEAGIAYVFLGRELGARSDDPACYDGNSQVVYAQIAAGELFRSGLERVCQGAESHRVSLMCAEKDPLTCHRSILVSRKLREMSAGPEVRHILEDGSLENHAQAEARLMEMLGIAEEDLFLPREAQVARAYELQESKIAYRRPAEPAEP